MRRAFVSLLAVALVVVGGASGAVSAAGPKKAKTVPDELIVGFKPGTSESAQSDALARAGATNKKAIKQIRARVVKGPEQKLTEIQKVLADDPRVAYVEPNYVVSTSGVPNDPQFSQLWGMNNTGQTGGTADADIDAPEAWDLETGSSNVVVAVIDTGVDFSHPDLAQQQWVNPGENCGSSDPTIACPDRTDGVDDDNDGYVDDWRGWDFINHDNDPTDDNNHGTHVSGTIGAVGNNGVGVAGVDWNARIMALKFLGSNGSGSDADAISAVLYAADHGARIASNSWGGAPFDQGLVDAIAYGASKGMLFVAAAGNDGVNMDVSPEYPAAFDSDALLSVAATDANDQMAFFSNYGARTVDLAAPGVGILSTTPGNTYQSFSGTSMAAPHVSGAAALVMSHFPGATLYGTKALLMRSVDVKSSLSGTSVTGGRLNVFNAMSCSSSPEVILSAPANGFAVGLGDVVPIKVIGANCASPAGLGHLTVTVNGSPVSLSAASPDNALYTGSYTTTTSGPQTVSASVSVGGSTATQTVSGTAAQNYSCADVPDTWVDARAGGKVPGGASDSDDGFTALNISFPFTYYGQTYTVAYVSSNGFLELGSSAGADAFGNTAIPNSATPNGVLAALWDDLNPASSGDVYAGVGGSPPNRVLYVEWFNVPHFNIGPSGTATFEVSLHESTGEIRYHWLDTDFGDTRWNLGSSATGGVERADGTMGRQISYNQAQLTTDRAVSCTTTTTPPPSPPSITTTTLADATNTQAYNASVAASGGTPPYAWSLQSGALPNGVSLDSSTGALSGAPSAAPGSYTFIVRVDDSATQNATKQLSIDVADPLAVTTNSLAGGVNGQSYSASLSSSGGKAPVSWSLARGLLPAGLTLGPSGTISGTPSATGTSNVMVQATDSGTPARTATKSLSITVVDPLVITTSSLPDGTVGASYSQTVSASGGQMPYSWTLASGSGPLPPGLSLGASSGTISGTPTSAGSYSFTVQVADSSQSDTQVLSITVGAAPPPAVAITTTSLPQGRVGVSYSATVTATGGTGGYTWTRASGNLPSGLSLTSGTPSATISGTPTKKGFFSFTLRVRDAAGTTVTRTFSITIVRR
jgi:subtilisin family serine protease